MVYHCDLAYINLDMRVRITSKYTRLIMNIQGENIIVPQEEEKIMTWRAFCSLAIIMYSLWMLLATREEIRSETLHLGRYIYPSVYYISMVLSLALRRITDNKAIKCILDVVALMFLVLLGSVTPKVSLRDAPVTRRFRHPF
jgi:cytochrome bd-type quinol oxidase subunit 2